MSHSRGVTVFVFAALFVSFRSNEIVTPAEAGVQGKKKELDSRFRGNDGRGARE